jgi:hypothetical protein
LTSHISYLQSSNRKQSLLLQELIIFQIAARKPLPQDRGQQTAPRQDLSTSSGRVARDRQAGDILDKKRARVKPLSPRFHYGGRPGDRTRDLWFRSFRCLANLLKSLQAEKRKLPFSCRNLQPIRNHFPRSAKVEGKGGETPSLPPFAPILTSIFKNKEAPLSP